MATSDPTEGSEDVNDFLRRIRELGDQRDQEDAERTRKLEEDILESRRQREARRADRARSISPSKGSPATTPRSLHSPRSIASPPPSLGAVFNDKHDAKIASPREPSPSTSESPRKTQQYPSSPSVASPKPSPSPVVPSRSSTLSRSGTLSWQQRPGGPCSRPLSLVENRKAEEPPQSYSADGSEDNTPSKEQIAKSLASKDPTWFRQTADRGTDSAAYRRDPHENSGATGGTVERRMLHGLSKDTIPRETRSDLSAQTRAPFNRTSDLSTPSSSKTAADGKSEMARISGDQIGEVGSLPQESGAGVTQQNDVFNSKPDLSYSTSIRPRSGRTSPERFERPASPTKGMGGFVQSAMMRRSDSISKRWSAQPAPDLARQNSAASNRHMRPGSRDSNGLPHSSNSAPSFGDVQSLGPDVSQGRGASANYAQESQPGSGGSEPATRSASDAVLTDKEPPKIVEEAQRSAGHVSGNTHSTSSPITGKRWSPVKASWLESALNKPESPKPKSQPPPSQPSWMVDLNRNRQQRMSRDISAASLEADLVVPKTPSDTSKVTDEKPKPNVQPLTSEAAKAPTKSDVSETVAVSRPRSPERTGGSEISNELPVATSSTMVSKPKPITPPKKDFRSALKPRDESPSKRQESEPEFRNAFGKLRQAKTEKYQAPDLLKDNIMRGKAGLATTGGPQKTQRRDELKESLLQQKAAMKVKAAEPPAPSKYSKPPVDPPTPEAIAKKKALGRSDSSGNILGPRKSVSDDKTDSVRTAMTPAASGSSEASTRGSSLKSVSTPVQSSQSQGVIGGKLAGRFNPALANILARGPPTASKAMEGPLRNTEAIREPGSSMGRSTNSSESSAPLEHMTKARARGPKRRAPKATASATMSNEVSKPVDESSDTVLTPAPSTLRSQVQPASESTPASETRPSQETVATSPVKTSHATSMSSPRPAETSKPQTPAKSPNLGMQQSPAFNSKAAIEVPMTPDEQSVWVRKSQANASPTNSAAESVRNAATRWGQPIGTDSSPKTRPQITLPTRADEEAKADSTSPAKDSRTRASTTETAPSNTSFSTVRSVNGFGNSRALPSTPDRAPAVPAKNAAANLENSSISPKKDLLSPPSQASEAGGVYGNFFDSQPVVNSDLTIDVQALLEPRDSRAQKTKTMRKSISSLTGGGKVEALPPNQEHVLFSTEMYLCTHVFDGGAGARHTEVYFWVGRDVGESVIEDAQLFARRAAKDAGGDLVKVQQGAEPATFFQALGGIMITRRGSPSASEYVSYLLCGRRHLAHIAFDEVDFSLSSFCAAFPYLVVPAPATTSEQTSSHRGENSGSNAKPRPIYLWKGTGCNAEEVGCARLISMDLMPSGTPSQVTEVAEGEEPSDFLSLFPTPAKHPAGKPKTMPRSADHWKLKSRHDNYAVRLFRVEPAAAAARSNSPAKTTPASPGGLWGFMRRGSEHDTRAAAPPGQTTADGQTVRELSPFSQADLAPQHIHVLDAFFEIYVVVGARAHAHAPAFATALLFAQEYGMLAASTQDRPFVPVGTVVLQGAPRDMKACFRAWRDDDNGGSAVREVKGDAALVRGRSLKIVPLSAAVAAARPSA